MPEGLAANLRSGLVKVTITPLWLMLPTLPSVIVANGRLSAPPGSTDERAAGWAERTNSAEGRDTAILAYETATARLNGLEAKGVGILQACALVAAGALIAYASDSWLAKVLGGMALAYLALAGWACCRVLVPVPREVVTAEDIGDEETYARIAAYVEGLAPLAGSVANLVTGAAYDLARASAITLVALLVALV